MGKIKKLWNIFITWATPIWNTVWGWIKKAGKILLRLFLVLLAIVSSIAFLAVPFLNNVLTRNVAQWIWYPATLILSFFVIMYCKKEKTPSNEPPVLDFLGKWGAVVVAFSFLSAFVLNYYDIDLVWKWIIAGFVAVYAPFFFFSLLAFDLSHNERSSEEKQKAALNTCKNIVLYWFFNLFYLSIVNDWLVPMFVFGIMALIIVAINLSDAFLNGAKSIRFFIALELVLSLVASVFLIYKIPNCTVQNIVLTISSALIGGILTLLGVAWTIKDTNDKRKDDLQRIENNRIEEDRQKYRPIVHVYAGPFSGVKTDINVFSWLHDTDKISKTETETLTVASRIHSCYFGNTDFSNVYVWGIKINGHMTHFSSIRYIKKESYFCLDFSDKPLYTEKPLETISLILEDVLENLYELPLEHTLSSSLKWHIIQGNNPSFYIGKAKKEDKYEQDTDGEGISAVHNQSGDRKKWLY